jgi:hypothetical protein
MLITYVRALYLKHFTPRLPDKVNLDYLVKEYVDINIALLWGQLTPLGQ